MKKIGLISVLVVLAGLAWYVIAGAQTAGNNATNTAVNDDSQQELIVVPQSGHRLEPFLKTV